MKGPEIVAVLKGIVNSTSLNTLHPQDKADIRRLLEIINQTLFYQLKLHRNTSLCTRAGKYVTRRHVLKAVQVLFATVRATIRTAPA